MVAHKSLGRYSYSSSAGVVALGVVWGPASSKPMSGLWPPLQTPSTQKRHCFVNSGRNLHSSFVGDSLATEVSFWLARRLNWALAWVSYWATLMRWKRSPHGIGLRCIMKEVTWNYPRPDWWALITSECWCGRNIRAHVGGKGRHLMCDVRKWEETWRCG